jgi:hypothetical protein
MRIIPEDVPKTLFSLLLGTYVSNVLQQGDCNGPSSWQRLMTHIFRKQIGTEVWVYLDDIYIFSKTLKEHENALEYVYKCLYDAELYMSPKKFNHSLILNFTCLIEPAQRALHAGFGREGTDGLPGTSAYGMPA